ncbi:MAG: DUF4142 domain-containing protein [Mucilaginibacter sp.]
MADLNKKQGEDFNKAYVDAMIRKHKETLDRWTGKQSMERMRT